MWAMNIFSYRHHKLTPGGTEVFEQLIPPSVEVRLAIKCIHHTYYVLFYVLN